MEQETVEGANIDKFLSLVSESETDTIVELKERIGYRVILFDKLHGLNETAIEWLVNWMEANKYSIDSDLREAVNTASAMEYFQNKKMYEKGAEDFVKKVNDLSKPSSNEK